MIENQMNRAVRVCFVSPKAYPLFNRSVEGIFGGSEVDLYYLATELAKDDNFQVSFITGDYGQHEVETTENVKLIKSTDFDKNAAAGALRIGQALRRAGLRLALKE